MNALAPITAQGRIWSDIDTIPDERRDGRDVLLWADGATVGRWFFRLWRDGEPDDGGWVDRDGRYLENVTQWSDAAVVESNEEDEMVQISDHACLRYLERVYGIDMGKVRAEMQTPALAKADEFGAPVLIGRHGERLIIREGIVVTVLSKGRYAGARIGR